MRQSTFDRLVAETLETLPASFRGRMENVEVVVEDWPDQETMRLAGSSHPSQLLGFYHGIPLTQRTHNYTLVLPDKISIYRRSIEMHCRRTGEGLPDAVRRVVRHEVAHYFGISDERLVELGAY